MSRRWLVSVLLLVMSTASSSHGQFIFKVPVNNGPTFFVRTDGNNACNGQVNAAGSSGNCAWRTIDFAFDTAVAGDTVRVQAGTYAELPASTHNGTSGNTITLIADGTVNVCGWDFSGNSYIRLIGFNFNNITAGCATRDGTVRLLGTNTKIEIWNNTFGRGVRGIGQTALSDRCNGCIFLGNFFTGVNVPDAGFGSGGGICCAFSDAFIAYNDLGPIDADAFNIQGVQNRFIGNYLHEVSQSSGHSDFWQTDAHDLGTQFLLAEANFDNGVGNLSDEHIGVIQNLTPSQCQVSCGAVTDNTWRRNVFYNMIGGLGVSAGVVVGTMLNTRYYSNTEVDTAKFGTTDAYSTNFYNGVDWVFVRNNVAHEAWGTGISSGISVYFTDASNSDFDYNLAYDPNGSVSFASFWTNQAHELSNTNPNFVNKAGLDFHLAAGSGDGANARGTGGPLTTATSCSGTTLNVATRGGGWFRGDNTTLDQYSGGLVKGDTITIASSTREVASISGDVITLTSSVTCSNGDPVYLGDDSTPDLGAFPYKSGGYTLTATYSCGGGTCTVTPNDASLVRFVVFYNNGIPYAVDNTSTYSAATPTGTFSARVYPMYATQPVSGVLWAVATP